MKNPIGFSFLIVIALFASCDKDKDQPKTPDYFEDLESSHEIFTSCGF
ncbi:MAG: hypothetical protein GQ574_02460 [Crocinitomix sp.]|nr:hypothetical protein [Crocinitomix sp.]